MQLKIPALYFSYQKLQGMIDMNFSRKKAAHAVLAWTLSLALAAPAVSTTAFAATDSQATQTQQTTDTQNQQPPQPPQGAPGQQQGKSASELTAAKVVDGTQATLSDLTLTSDADGANAVFATGSKSKVTAKNLRIHTKNNSSRGLDATYGGTIEAEDVDITTEGEHCAALATDRGEGTVTVQDGTFATSGQGSPNVYSTGKYSLQGTTQGRYLTGGVPPVRFSM